MLGPARVPSNLAPVAPVNPLLELANVPPDLARVEDALRRAVVAEDPFLTQVASHLIDAGGKRGRPAFAIGVAATTLPPADAVADDVIQGAVSVELVHLGSLYHDDVMDEATTRRNAESVNAKWGNLQAILAGDYLLAKASEIAARLGMEVAELLASTIGRLCEGQVLELQHTYQAARTEAAYLRSIEGKTASLYSTACRIGAITSGCTREQIDAATVFGRLYGMGFQIVDDILDLSATDEQLGKPAGHDLIEGVYTLPVLRVLGRADDTGATRLRQLFGKPLTEGEMDEAREIVRASGELQTALATATTYLDDAVAALAPLPAGPAREALAGAARHLLAAPTELLATLSA